MPEFVALDIETTGLDPQREAILEIGAVRFNGRRVEQEWSTLVNPGRRVPTFITQLTGISNQMVAQAPPISDVRAELQDFVGDAVIIGHNVRFDLSFLQRYRLFAYNETIDTYEMASVLLPNASRYGLGSLASQLVVPLPATHRALDDALVTHGVYLRLHELALELPLDLLADIVRLGEQVDWAATWDSATLCRNDRRRQLEPGQLHSQPGDPGSVRNTICAARPPWYQMRNSMILIRRKYPRSWNMGVNSRTIFLNTSTDPSRWRWSRQSPKHSPRRNTCWWKPAQVSASRSPT